MRKKMTVISTYGLLLLQVDLLSHVILGKRRNACLNVLGSVRTVSAHNILYTKHIIRGFLHILRM
jgi:hypothetical protein